MCGYCDRQQTFDEIGILFDNIILKQLVNFMKRVMTLRIPKGPPKSASRKETKIY